MPQMPSSKQQRCEQHELQQLGAEQLCSQAQLCSQPQLCSQQLGWLQPQPPPNTPKNAFALPALLSTIATATVAKAIQRFMGGLLQ
jgi:hypothetical protein